MRLYQFLLPLALASSALSAYAQTGIFARATTEADITFNDALYSTTAMMAFDGTNYWSSSGGSSSGERFAQYSGSGALVSKFSPGLDFRSLFVQQGSLYARAFNSPIIYKQTTPGVFATETTLEGSIDSQASVLVNGAGNEYLAKAGAVVTRWSLDGKLLGPVTLNGFGEKYDERFSARVLAAYGDYWYTYADGVVSAWDTAGNRVGETALKEAGKSSDSYFGFSVTNDRFWVVDDAGGTWRGYPIAIFHITPTSLPDGKVAAPYSQPFKVTGGVAPYVWSATGLPEGLKINAQTGVISGTPVVPGTSQLVVSVKDSAELQTTASITLRVEAMDLGIADENKILPSGQVGKAYSGGIVVSGGIAPYSFLLDGELPEGLSLDTATGAITGTPTKAQTTQFSITVLDSSVVNVAVAMKAAANTLTQEFSITVADVPVVPVTPAPVPDPVPAPAAVAVPVPTLGAWGLVSLSGLLVGIGFMRSRKRSA